jgi:hypothetical protein
MINLDRFSQGVEYEDTVCIDDCDYTYCDDKGGCVYKPVTIEEDN